MFTTSTLKLLKSGMSGNAGDSNGLLDMFKASGLKSLRISSTVTNQEVEAARQMKMEVNEVLSENVKSEGTTPKLEVKSEVVRNDFDAKREMLQPGDGKKIQADLRRDVPQVTDQRPTSDVVGVRRNKNSGWSAYGSGGIYGLYFSDIRWGSTDQAKKAAEEYAIKIRALVLQSKEDAEAYHKEVKANSQKPSSTAQKPYTQIMADVDQSGNHDACKKMKMELVEEPAVRRHQRQTLFSGDDPIPKPVADKRPSNPFDEKPTPTTTSSTSSSFIKIVTKMKPKIDREASFQPPHQAPFTNDDASSSRDAQPSQKVKENHQQELNEGQQVPKVQKHTSKVVGVWRCKWAGWSAGGVRKASQKYFGDQKYGGIEKSKLAAEAYAISVRAENVENEKLESDASAQASFSSTEAQVRKPPTDQQEMKLGSLDPSSSSTDQQPKNKRSLKRKLKSTDGQKFQTLSEFEGPTSKKVKMLAPQASRLGVRRVPPINPTGWTTRAQTYYADKAYGGDPYLAMLEAEKGQQAWDEQVKARRKRAQEERAKRREDVEMNVLESKTTLTINAPQASRMGVQRVSAKNPSGWVTKAKVYYADRDFGGDPYLSMLEAERCQRDHSGPLWESDRGVKRNVEGWVVMQGRRKYCTYHITGQSEEEILVTKAIAEEHQIRLNKESAGGSKINGNEEDDENGVGVNVDELSHKADITEGGNIGEHNSNENKIDDQNISGGDESPTPILSPLHEIDSTPPCTSHFRKLLDLQLYNEENHSQFLTFQNPAAASFSPKIVDIPPPKKKLKFTAKKMAEKAALERLRTDA